MAALEVIALDTATPQLRAPGTGDTYSAPRALAITPETLTGSAATSGLSITQTWNTTGTPTALKLDVTITAANNASLLMDLQAGGSSKFKVDRYGLITGDSLSLGTWFYSTASGSNVSSTGRFAFGSTNANSGVDVALYRDAANTLALRNSTNAQTFNVYSSYTDASNYTRAKLSAASGLVTLAGESAGTGDANIDVALTPKGTGAVRMGTHAALSGETVTGYITIKDAGGTTRKLAVVS